MYGWELPPFNSGGLGVACLGLAQALASQGVNLNFILPKKFDLQINSFNLFFGDNKDFDLTIFGNLLSPYIGSKEYEALRKKLGNGQLGLSLFDEVENYALSAAKIAKKVDHKLIHSHDWLTFPAGIASKKVSNKPLVVHVHATEFDRTGGNNINQRVYEIERAGMEQANHVVAVSNYTKNILKNNYGIKDEKISVVFNGINLAEYPQKLDASYYDLSQLKKNGSQIVVFVGRITLQKGLDYFLKAAKEVLKYKPKTYFVICGSGDMEYQMIDLSSHLGIAQNVIFTGFLRGNELNSIYKFADLFVMPSVSEPFGISALEALANQTPVLVSKQSGVSEALNHALKVDFWDTDEIANQIVSVLDHESLKNSLMVNGLQDLNKLSWNEAAKKMIGIYNKYIN